MKKLLTSVCLLALVLVCVFVLPANAEAVSINNLRFKLNSDGNSYSVTACISSAGGALEIPATHNGKPVTTIGERAFYGCVNLVEIAIPDSITTLNQQTFSNCTNLAVISLPKSITSIGYEAFRFCAALEKVHYTGSKEDWNQRKNRNRSDTT